MLVLRLIQVMGRSTNTPCMSLPKSINLHALRRMPKFAFYFRYPLHENDFSELRANHRLLGYLAAKPLYGRLTAAGKVDRRSGLNGKIATIFIPSPARSPDRAELLVTRIPRSEVILSNGRRNWPAIRRAAEKAILDRPAIR